MPVEVKLDYQEVENVRNALARAPRAMASELHTALGKIMVALTNRGIKEAPVNKQSGGGNLRQSIRFGWLGSLGGEVVAGAKYSGYVHEGTSPHIIRSHGQWLLRNKRTNEVFGRVVNHPGTKANPFFERAVQGERDTISNELKGAADRAMSKSL